jgi:hypothetical protein
MPKSQHECTWLAGREGEKRVRDAVNRALRRSRGPVGAEERDALRAPFFGPVTISVSGEESPRFSAFARDVSPLGVGLLHIMPLEPGPVVVTLRGASGDELSLRTQIMWCKSAGEGWYMSGGRFLDIFDDT